MSSRSLFGMDICAVDAHQSVSFCQKFYTLEGAYREANVRKWLNHCGGGALIGTVTAGIQDSA
jgi:hypothetical protein